MAVTKDEVARLYVATFDRAPDATGFDYWVKSGRTIAEIAESFFGQDETAAKYPSTLSNADFVDTIYQNVYNRHAEPNGLSYWSKQLDSGAIARNDMILAITNPDAAQGDDKKTIENKVTVGLDFTDSNLNDYKHSVSIMSGITADIATVNAAANQISQWEHDSADYAMINGKDDWTGTDGADAVSGSIAPAGSTYQGIDKLDGGTGDDTLKITSSVTAATTTGGTTVKNIENMVVTTTGIAATTLNLQNYDSSVKNITVDGNGSNVTFGTATAGQQFDKVVDHLTLSNTATSTTTINYEAGAAIGTADTMDVTLSSGAATTQTLTTNQVIENLNVHSNGGNFTINEGAKVVKTVTLDGSAMTLATAGGTTIANVDAHTMTGNLTIGAGALATGDGHVQGGSAIDNITGPATAVGHDLTIDGNAGNDTITVGAVAAGGINHLNGGDGNDTITSTAAVAGSIIHIDGGAGRDVITAGGGTDILKYANTGDSAATAIGSDTVTAFASGTDSIDFDTLAAGSATNFTATAGAAGFTASMNAADAWFGGAAGRIYYMDTTSHILFVDSDGDAVADSAIQFTGATAIASADIIA